MNTPFEKRICYTICLCQMTAVLSCVSLVYLTVAIYSPAHKTLNSGFSEVPVMCTTVSNESVVNCENKDMSPSWASCGEWCLSKSGGTCVQIYVDVRLNGTNIRLEECENLDAKYCDGVNPKMEVQSCRQGQCSELHGIYNCSIGPTPAIGAQCRNLSSVLACTLTTTDAPKMCNNKQNCAELEGLYNCQYGNCSKILAPYKCEKRCISIKTGQKSVLIRQGDVIFTAKCKRAMEADSKDVELWPLGKTSVSDPSEPPMLVMFCTNVLEGQNQIHLSDCFNGTLLEPGHFGNLTNITYVVNSHLEATEAGKMMDPLDIYAPYEQSLLIRNNTPLLINYEGCVNTLILNECEKFHADYGSDGKKDLRSQSRFPCYYSNITQLQSPGDFVVLRFDRIRTIMELLIAACVPVTLAIVSCFTLVICTRVIHVGDDSHLTFQCCGSDAQAALEKEAVEAMAI